MVYIATKAEPTYDEAISSPYANEWRNAIQKEYSQLMKMKVFEWVPDLPPGKKAVGSKIILREKLDSYGKHVKFKARIMAQGFSQIPGLDYNETFSSVAKFTTLRIFLTIEAILDFEIHQIDVVATYLQGDLDEEIYMKIPKGTEGFNKDGYWRLLKAIYGLKQAGHQWKKKLHMVLTTKLNLIQTTSDDCLYILWKDERIILMVLVYVDNIMAARPNIGEIILFKKNLDNNFEITDLGDIKYILGILVT